MSLVTSIEPSPADVTPTEVDSLAGSVETEFVLATEDAPQADSLGEGWVTLSEAADLLDESTDRLRRKLRLGDMAGQLAFDASIGRERWMVDTSRLAIPAPDLEVVTDLGPSSDPGAESDSRVVSDPAAEPDPHKASDPGVLVPMEAIDRLEEAWSLLRDAVARAEVAERRADFEKQRRQDAEQERTRLQQLLKAENEIAVRVMELERQRRQDMEEERDRLRAVLEAEQIREKWWRR